jgi:hypothetical protein
LSEDPRREARVHDYVCSVCARTFSVTERAEDSAAEGERVKAAAVVCPSCGSPLVREGWESRLRNAAGRKPPRPIEEMRDSVG